MQTTPTTIRLTEEEKQEAMQKAQTLGLRTLSDFIRYAIKRTRVGK